MTCKSVSLQGHKMIAKPKGAAPTDFEAEVAQAILNVGVSAFYMQ